MRPRIWRNALAFVLAGALLVSGCGDDDDEAADATGGDAEVTVADYCTAVAEVGEALPDEEQMDRILEVAPEEIAENLEVVIGAIRENGEAAFGDPAVVENFAPIEAFEAENCGDGEAAAEIDPEATRIDVTATEYAFDLAEPTSGPVSFVMTNEGEEVHEIALARLEGDTSLEEALASEDAETEGLIEPLGFAGPASPGDMAVINVDLTPGDYAIVCLIPLGDGTTHADEGMASQFTVGP